MLKIIFLNVANSGTFGCSKCFNSGVPATVFLASKKQIYIPCNDDLVLKDNHFFEMAYERRHALLLQGNLQPFFGVRNQLFIIFFRLMNELKYLILGQRQAVFIKYMPNS